MVGRTISHYKILKRIGSGGMGEVYKVEDLKLGRHVALQFLAAHLVSDPEIRKRFGLADSINGRVPARLTKRECVLV